MRLKKMVLGLVMGVGIVTAAAFVPGKEAKAEDGWNCLTKRHGSDCGCPDCWIKNCQCPVTPVTSQPVVGG